MSCGVCGANLSEVASENLEQLVHTKSTTTPKKKLNRGALILIVVALTVTGTGISLLVLLNALGEFFLIGIFLVLVGLVTLLGLFGGPGRGSRTRLGRGTGVPATKATLQRDERSQEEEQRTRKKGEED